MKEKFLQIGSRTADLLLDLGNKVSDVNFGLTRPSLVLRFGVEDARKFLDAKERRLHNQALQRLAQKKMIRLKKMGEQIEVKLTDQGLSEYFRHSLIRCDILPKEKFCMVVFDIPETERTVRQRLRRFLSRSAFVQMQRSVWISNIDAADVLSKFLNVELRKNWIRIFISTEY